MNRRKAQTLVKLESRDIDMARTFTVTEAKVCCPS